MWEIDEEVLSKTGPDLFRELLRVYSVAEVEDYFKNGQWRDDMMKVDLELVTAHRREAGAPEAPALEDVQLVKQPMSALAGAARPVLSSGVGAAGARPRPPTVSQAGTSVSSTSSTAGPVAELRLIGLFVAKWKLDPGRSKLLLSRLMPTRRRYVIQHFKATPGVDPTAALEQFIAKCQATNSWNATAGGSAAAPASGVKRPLPTATSASDPSKRPRLVGETGVVKAASQASPKPKAAHLAAVAAARLAMQRAKAAAAAGTIMRPAAKVSAAKAS
eukprot:CAMPEP_0176176496 /NCGR_PEP_ID=MMETSP0120_2-20121206/90405_1 /TAXON_ID=160619 /ORGANISM="Kryptoperidinium foliaceum, Strain CCMP 1326" /LENGTH=274 /DNA_ID=CAMNT_0017514543 /DNA_START=1 /DNA_END=821 /DNA_ORIENTATION=-